MADAQAFISVPTAQRIIDGVKRVEAMPSSSGAGGPGDVLAAYFGRIVKITGCTKGTGYATAQFCKGDPGGTLTPDTGLTVKVFIGINSFWRKDDYVIVLPVACPSVHWVAVASVTQSTLYKDPATDGSSLATTQDTPLPDSYCTDSVVVP